MEHWDLLLVNLHDRSMLGQDLGGSVVCVTCPVAPVLVDGVVFDILKLWL